MTSFYKSAYQRGNKLFITRIDNGVQSRVKVDFHPTMYTRSRTKGAVDEGWKYLLDGKPLYPVRPGTIKDTKEFLDMYKDVHGFQIYGNTNFVQQFIAEEYPGVVEYDMRHINVTSMDIETTTENGFPQWENPSEAVTLITLKKYDVGDEKNEFITFGVGPYKKTQALIDYEEKHGRVLKVKYVECRNEESLYKEFVAHWQQYCPDIVTGWNIDTFDIPYLYQRMVRVMGEDFVKKLSPWNSITTRYNEKEGNLYVDILGVASFDYLSLYKKFTYTAQENYKLDNIAFVELGMNKLEHDGSFKDFYTNHWNKFVDYNIVDVDLVDRLEEKMKLIELGITVSYYAKVNFDDVFSATRLWDSIIYHYLLKKQIVIPAKLEGIVPRSIVGGYVKKPQVGLHRWVLSFDLASLYPHLIKQYNISPETIRKDHWVDTNVEALLIRQTNTSYVKEENLSLTASGFCYTNESRGFLPELMDSLYTDRKKAKKQMLGIEQDVENMKGTDEESQIPALENKISSLDNLQLALKILLNSAYGAMANEYFRYFDPDIAESITMSGQLSVRWVANAFNDYFNKAFKTEGVDYIIAIDTDSNYIVLDRFVEKFCKGMTEMQIHDMLQKFANEHLQKFVEKTYGELAEYMNAYENAMSMKLEVISPVAIWAGAKTYAMKILSSEGVLYKEPKYKIMGMSMIKSSTPVFCRTALKEITKVVLNTNEEKLQEYVENFKLEFYKAPAEQIAFPRGVNNISKYDVPNPPTTPIHVRAALVYNKALKDLELTKSYPRVVEGDKIKFIYLKPRNRLMSNVVGFLDTLPDEFAVRGSVDYDTMFDKTFIASVRQLTDAIGWSTERISSLEDFFG